MCFLYRLDCSGQPAYLKDLMFHGRSSRTVQLVVPRFEMARCKKTLFVQGIIDWNSIPARIRMVNSSSLFRERCLELFNRRSNPTIYE